MIFRNFTLLTLEQILPESKVRKYPGISEIRRLFTNGVHQKMIYDVVLILTLIVMRMVNTHAAHLVDGVEILGIIVNATHVKILSIFEQLFNQQ